MTRDQKSQPTSVCFTQRSIATAPSGRRRELTPRPNSLRSEWAARSDRSTVRVKYYGLWAMHRGRLAASVTTRGTCTRCTLPVMDLEKRLKVPHRHVIRRRRRGLKVPHRHSGSCPTGTQVRAPQALHREPVTENQEQRPIGVNALIPTPLVARNASLQPWSPDLSVQLHQSLNPRRTSKAPKTKPA